MTNTENNTVATENTNTETARKSRKDIPLGNRFANLPVFGADNAPAVARDDVLTLAEVAELANRSKLTATKYLREAEVDAVCLVPTGSVGRPAPAYPRELVEAAIGDRFGPAPVAPAAAEADDLLAAAAEIAGSIG
jgi:hypothetical protein